MQIILLAIIIVLSIVLYRMLSTRRMSYPFVRVARFMRTEENKAYTVAEAEEGMITIDEDTIIVEGHEYSLKTKKGEAPEGFLNIQDGRLISIGIRIDDEERIFFIDPEHNQIDQKHAPFMPQVHAQQHFIFSV